MNPAGFTTIRVSAFDYYSRLNGGASEVSLNFPIPEWGRSAGDNLADLFQDAGDHIWELQLPTPINDLPNGELTVRMADFAGNVTEIKRSFSIGSGS